MIDDDRLYLKVDESNRADFEREGSAAFRPYGEGSHPMSCDEVPVRVLEHADELSSWIERSWEVAGRKKTR